MMRTACAGLALAALHISSLIANGADAPDNQRPYRIGLYVVTLFQHQKVGDDILQHLHLTDDHLLELDSSLEGDVVGFIVELKGDGYRGTYIHDATRYSVEMDLEEHGKFLDISLRLKVYVTDHLRIGYSTDGFSIIPSGKLYCFPLAYSDTRAERTYVLCNAIRVKGSVP